jgi:glucoamylase
MKQTQKITLLALVLFYAGFHSSVVQAQAPANYTTEYRTAITRLMANLQSNGGVVAAPSHVNPDYFYDWIRDTSLTMKTVVELAYDSTTPAATKTKLMTQINAWVGWELGLQTTPKLTGLGEPRFYLNGLANNNPWARPQNDGPALRALTAIELANHWIQDGRLNDVNTYLYAGAMPAATLIKRDLEYVSHHWDDQNTFDQYGNQLTFQSFDLWEETQAMQYYTLTVQKVALLKGAALARSLNDSAAGDFYEQQSQAIDNYLNQFYDPNQNIIRYAINKTSTPNGKSGDLDVAVLLAAIQTFDGQFYVNVPQMVSTVNALTTAFGGLYSVNKITANARTHAPLGTALGRYPQDTYNGDGTSAGNPWFLATIALAEFSCDLKKISYNQGASDAQLVQAANGQFNRVLYHTNADGSLSEQYNRDSGYEQGANNLTWSYTAYITAYRACF